MAVSIVPKAVTEGEAVCLRFAESGAPPSRRRQASAGRPPQRHRTPCEASSSPRSRCQAPPPYTLRPRGARGPSPASLGVFDHDDLRTSSISPPFLPRPDRGSSGGHGRKAFLDRAILRILSGSPVPGRRVSAAEPSTAPSALRSRWRPMGTDDVFDDGETEAGSTGGLCGKERLKYPSSR